MPITVPNVFVANTLIVSDEVNENFAHLGQQALNRTGDTLTGDLVVEPGVLIDGVDISEVLGLPGDMNVNTIVSSGAATIGGNLSVAGDTALGGCPPLADMDLTVCGASTFKGTTAMQSSLVVGGATTLSANLNVMGTASFLGPANFTGSLRATSFFEQSRTTAMGYWVTVPFTATDFTAPAPGVWTLTAPDLVTFHYTVVGKTMHVAFTINDSSVGVAEVSELRIKIPGGFTGASATARGVIGYIDAGQATSQVGSCAVFPAATFIRLFTFGGPWNIGTNNTDVNGSITFEVA